jgi:NDP-sugar pyrophosphorylase family protein
MAGRGSRFSNRFPDIPKPFVRVAHQPLFKHALASMADCQDHATYHAVVQKTYLEQPDLKRQLFEVFPERHVKVLDHVTRGAAESARSIIAEFDQNDAVLVLDCDLYFTCAAYFQCIKQNLASDNALSGILTGFVSEDPRYSYASCDAEGRVKETAEKKVISKNAIAGAYYFSSARNFLNAYEQSLREWEHAKSEFYLSTLFASLIALGGKIRYFPADVYLSLGTPEEIDQAASHPRISEAEVPA